MDEHPKLIESNPNVTMGKPVVAGTRITVESILAQGETREQLAAVFLPVGFQRLGSQLHSFFVAEIIRLRLAVYEVDKLLREGTVLPRFDGLEVQQDVRQHGVG